MIQTIDHYEKVQLVHLGVMKEEKNREKIQNEADICYFNNWIIVVHYLEHYAHSISVSLFFSIYPSLFPFAHLLTRVARSFIYLALSVDLCLFDTSKHDRKLRMCVSLCVQSSEEMTQRVVSST